MNRATTTHQFLAMTFLAALASAQSSDPMEAPSHVLREPASPAVSGSHGFSLLDGRIVGGGPAYRAELGAGEVAFTPAFGRRVAQSQTLTLELESVRREEGAAWSASGTSSPRLEGGWAIYDHADGVHERYEARVDVLEQEIVLDAPLSGAGDLVVRYRIDTPLDLPVESAGVALRFQRAGVGGIRVDTVVGIDAAGARHAGSLRAVDGETSDWLEIVVPAAFADGAAYPLTIDPAYGVEFELGDGFDNSNPDVATEQTSGVSLAVWQTQFSISDIAVRGQRLGVFGELFGPLLTIETNGGIAQRPVVAARNLSQRFVVVWEQGPFFAADKDLWARSVDSLTGTISALSIVSAQSGDDAWPTMGNDHPGVTGSPNEGVVLAWRNGASVRSSALSTDGAGLVQATPAQTIVNFVSSTTHPRISGTGGHLGRWLVVWDAPSALFSPDTGVFGAILDRNNALVTGPTLLVSEPGRDLTAPSCDADATQLASNFMVAYERPETVDPSSHDVYALSLNWNGASFVTNAGPLAIEADVNDDEIGPAVASASSKVFIAYADEGGSFDHDVYMKGVNFLTCTTCESESLVATVLGDTVRDLRMRTQGTSPTPAYGRSYLVWTRYDGSVPFEGNVMVQPVDTVMGTGTMVDLGGGCGGGGTVDDTIVSGPSIGDPGWGLRNLTADTLATVAVLNLSTPAATIPCGTCQFLPYQITFVVPKEPEGFGLVLPLPCDTTLIGAQLDAQWTVLPTASSPCFLAPNVSLSNIARLTIGI